MAMIKGRLACPDCGSEQDVKFDGRKYYINCDECGTMSTYQSKAAKARLEKRLAENASQPDEIPETEVEEKPEIVPKEKPIPAPVRLSRQPGKLGFFEHLNNLFDDEEKSA